MEIYRLKSFVAVVECGSFLGAAKKLYISQPSVTEHVAALERELGHKLIFRSTREINVTDDGWNCYQYAKQILGLAEDLVSSLERKKKRRDINIIMTSGFGYAMFPLLAGEYIKKESKVSFHIEVCNNSQEMISKLKSGIADVAFTTKDFHLSSLVCIYLGKSKYTAILPNTREYEGWTEALTEKEYDEKIVQFPVILPYLNDDVRMRFENTWKKSVSALRPEIVMETDEMEIMIEGVRNGLGMTVVPDIVAERLSDDERIRQMHFSHFENIPCENYYMNFAREETDETVLKFCRFVQKWYKGR